MKHLLNGMKLLMFGLLLTACSIDDELRNCTADFNVKYTVTLHTNLKTQVQTILRERFENDVADILEDQLKDIFREYAHDVDLYFYIDNKQEVHNTKIMDAGQATYELELPAKNYRHLALANIAQEDEVVTEDTEWADRSLLKQEEGDIIDSHKTGLFTAAIDMNILGDEDQTFDVPLLMVNSATILVVRTDNVEYKDCQVFSSDFADGYHINNDTYTHTSNPMVRDIRVTNPPVEREVYYAVTFPSYATAEEAHEDPLTRAGEGETGASEEQRIWRKFVYVTLPDGTITRTIINVRTPLEAGQVMIIYSYMRRDGSIYSPNVEVGTSVTFDWKDGLVIGG